MLFANIIRNRYWLRTRKTVKLIFYAPRYRKVMEYSLCANESRIKISRALELSLSRIKSY